MNRIIILLIALFITPKIWGQTIYTMNGDSILTGYNYEDMILKSCIPIDSTAQDSLDQICAERGHIITYQSVTLGYYSPRTVDLPNKTIKIWYDQNTYSGRCSRCGKNITAPVMAKPDTIVIWRRYE